MTPRTLLRAIAAVVVVVRLDRIVPPLLTSQ